MKKTRLFDCGGAGGCRHTTGPALRAGRPIQALILAVFASILLTIPAFGALGVISTPATSITTTGAVFGATITGTNASNPSIVCFYGTVDYSNNAALWGGSNVYGTAGTGAISTNITGLLPLHKYYFNWLASDGVSNIWATTGASSNFWTHPSSPTSTPSAVSIYVAADPITHILQAPLDFFTANGIVSTGGVVGSVASLSTTGAVGGAITFAGAGVTQSNRTFYFAGQGSITNSISSEGSVSISQSGGPQPNLSVTSSIASAISGVTSRRYFARTNASETVEVNASAYGVTVARTNSTFYWSIPVGAHVNSWKIRVDGSLTDGGKIYFVWGTNDVNNSSVALGWNTTVDGFREDWNAKINPTALPSIADPTQTVISGLPTTPGTISQIHGGL